MFCLSRHFLLLVLKNYALLTYRKPLLQLFRGHFVISFSHTLTEYGFLKAYTSIILYKRLNVPSQPLFLLHVI